MADVYNVLSEDIKVFPSTKRGTYQRSSRLISEENLVNIVNKLIDKDSFAIKSSEINILTNNDPLQFNIHGYYFSVDHIGNVADMLPSDVETIYANIITATETTTVGDITYEYTELQGQDTGSSSSTYTGVSFTADGPDTSPLQQSQTRYSLKILEKIPLLGTFWRIPEESLYKYDGQSIFGNIDGGTV